jgi:hypothetical protein
LFKQPMRSHAKPPRQPHTASRGNLTARVGQPPPHPIATSGNKVLQASAAEQRLQQYLQQRTKAAAVANASPVLVPKKDHSDAKDKWATSGQLFCHVGDGSPGCSARTSSNSLPSLNGNSSESTATPATPYDEVVARASLGEAPHPIDALLQQDGIRRPGKSPGRPPDPGIASQGPMSDPGLIASASQMQPKSSGLMPVACATGAPLSPLGQGSAPHRPVLPQKMTPLGRRPSKGFPTFEELGSSDLSQALSKLKDASRML